MSAGGRPGVGKSSPRDRVTETHGRRHGASGRRGGEAGGGSISSRVAAQALEGWALPRESEGFAALEFLEAEADLPPGSLLPILDRVEAAVRHTREEAVGQDADRGTADASAPATASPRGRAEGYRDLRYVGHGGMGVVYDAYDPDLQRRVALKFMRVDDVQTPAAEPPSSPLLVRPGGGGPRTQHVRAEAVQRFLREARITARIQHPAVLPIYEIGATAHGVPYYAMELLPSKQTFRDVLPSPDVTWSDERLRLLEIFLRVCDAVGLAHEQGIVHRDLKPSNIGMADATTPYVLDWGLAKDLHEDDSARPQRGESPRVLSSVTGAGFVGTPGYIAPEVAKGGSGALSPTADVFSLGAMLFQILTGRMPDAADEDPSADEVALPAERLDGIARSMRAPAGLTYIALLALDPDPSRRFGSGRLLAEAVRTWQSFRVAEQEVKGWLREARRLHKAADTARGGERIRLAERGLVLVGQMKARELKRRQAETLRVQFEELRGRGIEEEGRAGRRQLLLRVGVVAAIVLTAASLVVARHLDRKRSETEDALERAEASSRHAHAATERAQEERLRAESSERLATERAEEAEQARRDTERAARRSLANARGAHAGALARLTGREGEALRLGYLAVREVVDAGESAPAAAVAGLSEALGAVHASMPITHGQNNSIHRAAFSPDGARILTAALDGTLRVFDTEVGDLVADVDLGEPGLADAAYGRAGDHIATAGRDGSLRLFDAADLHEIAAVAGDDTALHSVVISPDGHTVLAVGENGAARLWQSQAGGTPTPLEAHTGHVAGAAFSPDGAVGATAGWDGRVGLWRTADGALLQDVHLPGVAWGVVVFSPDGRHVAAAGGRRLFSGDPYQGGAGDAAGPAPRRRLARRGRASGRDARGAR